MCCLQTLLSMMPISADLFILEYSADGKPETKSDSMLVWAAHHDPEMDNRSMLLNCTL